MEDKNIPTNANIKLKSLKANATLYKVNIETGIYIPPTKEVIIKNNIKTKIGFPMILFCEINSIPK